MSQTARVLASMLFLWHSALAVSAADDTTNPKLKDLAWLAGVWTAELNGPNGKPMTIETTFEWSRHRQALNYVVVFKGDGDPVTQYEGLYFYHPGAKEVRLLQTNRSGNVTESVVTFDDGKMLQENKAYSVDGTLNQQRVEVTQKGETQFEFKGFAKQGDTWVDAIAITYKRAKGAQAP